MLEIMLWILAYLASGIALLALAVVWFCIILVVIDFMVDLFRYFFPKEEEDPFNMQQFENER